MKDKYDVIIIGAGMGGLSSAAWLAYKGMKVLVVEQNVQPGGLCSSYKRDGFNFTPAASILTGTTKKDGVFYRLIKQLGIEKEIELIPLEQGYHVHLPDFDYFLFSGGEEARDRLIEQLIKLFPHEADGIRAFFRKLSIIYQQADYCTFLGTSPLDVLRILCKCPTLVVNMGKGIVPFVKDYIKDPKLTTVLSLNSTCANLPPSKMSLIGIAGLLIEGGLSNPHVKGGPQAVSESFAKCVCNMGGDVLLGYLVEKIIIEDKKACGIRIVKSPIGRSQDEGKEDEKPKEIQGKYIISNAAARQTFHRLVGDDNLNQSFLKYLGQLEPTPPYSALFLGLDMDLKKMGLVPALHIHSSTYDIEEHFKNVASKMVNENGVDPFFRFQLAPLSDPSSAPPGKTALVVHTIPVPSQSWENEEWQKRAVELMIKRAEKVIPDLSKHIVYKELWSPVTINEVALTGLDASIGWALTPKQVGPKRLSQETPIKNLLLSGHWTQPAIGVLAATISGLKAARTILQREGVKEPLTEIGIRKGLMMG